ncbi:MAG TPA: heavy-metal-associated domain-containing protein, partial [Chakrabartia sp.]|nr:heavy-metal-associated domain-containing protein [Chakrabartia sp.]
MVEKKPVLRLVPMALALAIAGGGAALFAQIEGVERGIIPIGSANNLEVGGVEVDVWAKNADDARLAGWKEAQRKGWVKLWDRYHGGGSVAPALGDAGLDAIVSAVIIEDEQIGPNRYVARLGVAFDRVRAAQVLGIGGRFVRSAPMLVLPIEWNGGAPVSFEGRTEWQKAWAQYNTADSQIDYVRTSGNGAEPLLLTYGQTGRPGRRFWRNILDQYGAADVLIPSVRLQRLYPGGPVIGHFAARYGPDNKLLQTFSLRVESSDRIGALMKEGVKRMDEIYANALASGLLKPDTSLIIEEPVEAEAEEETANSVAPVQTDSETATADTEDEATPDVTVSSFTIQFDTPDAGAVNAVESAVRAVPGVRSASTTSLAIGGVSVMRVSFAGDAGMLRLGLSARGLSASESGGVIR